MAEALYRKYRPQTFEDVVGQDHIERTLKNAIDSDKVSHAYLFTGPRGTGKTTTARILAKALLCEKGVTATPDGTCEDCTLIANGEHPDVYELDAASRTGVENVREEIIGRVNYAPTRGRYKVYIIDEVHMLSTAAFNALLKTLEEPPSHVVFILCTTDPQKVPETIHSRCQRFDFRRIASEELISRLGAICELEGVDYEGDALDLIAHRAQGGMRDALTSLEQLITFSNGNVSTEEAERLLGSLDSNDLAEIVKAIGKRDAAACFRWTSEYMETGADLAGFTNDLASHIRDMYVMSLAGSDVALEITEAGRRELESELSLFGSDRLARMLAVLGDLISDLKTSTNQRLTFEIALTRLIRPDSDITMEALAERLEALESAFSTGAASLPSASKQVSSGAKESREETHAKAKDERPVEKNAASAKTAVSVDVSAGDNSASDMSQGTSKSRGTSAILNPNQLWENAMAKLKNISEPYAALFLNVKIVADNDSIKIVFGKNNNFVYSKAQSPEVKKALREALNQAGGEHIKLLIVKDKDGDIQGTSTATETDAPSDVAASQVDDTATKAPAEDAPSQTQDSATDATDAADAADAKHAATTDISSETELNDVLSTAFGEGIVFEEID